MGVEHCVVEEGRNARIEQWVAGEGGHGNGERGNDEDGGEG